MADGIRIRHTDPEVRGCVLLVPVQKVNRKDINIHVDGTGHSVVSTGVWEELELARSQGWNHGFEISNTVLTPPNLQIGIGVKPMFKPTKRLIEQAIRDIAPRGTTVTITR